MNREDIIRMAQEAGMQTVFAVIEEHEDGTKTVIDHRPFLERFADLVTAKEREACAKLCEEVLEPWLLREYIDKTVDAIRERGEK